MKIKIVLLALLCAATLCQAQNKIDNQGRRQGHWIKTDKDGSRIFEGTFVDGKETGEFKYFYPDGTLKIRNTFTIPGRYCRHEAYDKDGHMIATGYYDQQNRDSVWTFYNEQGRVVKIASYRMGVKQGRHIIFDAAGDTAEVSGWRDNHRDGRWWKRIGKKGWITGHYVKGLMQGRLSEFDDNGKLVREGFYKDGAKHGTNRLYENGLCTVDEKWQEGTLVDRKILLNCPKESMISVFDIAYVTPKGSKGTNVYLNDGKRLACIESIDVINNRIGSDQFLLVDRKNQVIANRNSINGIKKSSDGRDILDLSPTPPFTIFPDEECTKMIRSLQRGDELD